MSSLYFLGKEVSVITVFLKEMPESQLCLCMCLSRVLRNWKLWVMLRFYEEGQSLSGFEEND